MYKVMILYKKRFAWQCVKVLSTETEALQYARDFVNSPGELIDDVKVVKIRTEIE